MKSNGWTDETAALQLFVPLNGEALNVALLMPEGELANWEGLSQGLSDESGHVCYIIGDPGSLRIRRHGQVHP